MKEYSKYNKTDLMVVITLIVLLSVIVIIIFNRKRHVSKYEEEEFLKNLDACNKLAEIYYEDYKKNNTDSILQYSLIESGVIYCNSWDYYIMLSDEYNEICEEAVKSFRKSEAVSNIYHIYAYDTFVSFCGGDNKKSVIYSAEDKWPSYVSCPDETFGKNRSRIILKITKHWYKAYIYEGL